MTDGGTSNVGRDVIGASIGTLNGPYAPHYHFDSSRAVPSGKPPFCVSRPRPAVFAGRDALLTDLCARLCSPQPTRLVLEGASGIGKTTLALALAHTYEVQKHFTGGVLWASLGEHAQTESELRRWDDYLRVPLDRARSVPEQFNQIVASISERGQPCLLLIDDVWQKEDVRVFQHGSKQISMLFTSDKRDIFRGVDGFPLHAEEEQFIAVPLLDADAVIALLRLDAALPAVGNEAALAALAALVGGLPWSVRLLGHYVRAATAGHANWFAAALGALRADAKQRNRSLTPFDEVERSLKPGRVRGWFGTPPPITRLPPTFLLDLCVANLPDAAQRVLIRLAAFEPEPLSVDLDTALAVLDHDDTAAIALLVRRALLHQQDDRLRMPRPVWQWVQDHHHTIVQTAQRAKHAWHLELAEQEGSAEFAAWARNPDNWQQMLETWRDAHRNHNPNELRACILTLVPVLIRYGYENDVLVGLEQSLTVFVGVDAELIATIHYRLGLVCYRRADYSKSRQHAQVALTSFEKVHSVLGRAATLTLLGHISYSKGWYPVAQAYHQDALDLTPPEEQLSYAACLNHLGLVLHKQGGLEAARKCHEQALAICVQALPATHPDLAATYNNLGNVLRDQSELEAARKCHEQALAICVQALPATHPKLATIYNNLGQVLRAQGELETGRKCHEQALAIQEQVLPTTHPDLAVSYSNLSWVLCDLGEYDEALKHAARAIAIAESSLGSEHPTTRTCQSHLEAVQQIAAIARQAEADIEQALAEGDDQQRAAVAQGLEEQAQQVAEGAKADSARRALAGRLRAMAARLRAADAGE